MEKNVAEDADKENNEFENSKEGTLVERWSGKGDFEFANTIIARIGNKQTASKISSHFSM